jgi:PII-like signaling protein
MCIRDSIHIAASDRFAGKPLYEAIILKCRELKIAGATVFRGLEGYGESAEIHKHHLARGDEPILITVIDTAEAIDRLIPEIEPMIDTGLLAVSTVEVIRVHKQPHAGGPGPR